jgi:aryl-alcohol dehydrogenase-like predicted oxidoreductase
MKYNRLGNSGLFVSEICLGTMTFGGKGALYSQMGSLPQSDVTALVARSLEAGVNFIDTANVYSEGVAESFTGKALKELGVRRSDVVLATKFLGRMGPGWNDAGASRGHIMDSVARSLERLQTDYIDLYQIHGVDPITPLEETMRALDDLVRQGMVRYIGCSNMEAWRIVKAQGIAARHDTMRFETLQAYHSIAGRDLERDVVPMLADQKMGLLVWSALAGGLLSGKFGPGVQTPEDARRVRFDFPPVDKEKAWPIVEAMRAIGKAHGVSVARVALAWTLARPFVTSLIIGVKSLEQLNDNLAATELKLSEEELKKLDTMSALSVEYPHWMVERQALMRLPQKPK